MKTDERQHLQLVYDADRVPSRMESWKTSMPTNFVRTAEPQRISIATPGARIEYRSIEPDREYQKGWLAMTNHRENEYRDKWLDERFANIDQKLDYQNQLIQESLRSQKASLDQFLGEMRDRDNQRHSEIVAARQETQNALIEIRSSNRQITWAVGIGAIAIAAAILIAHFFPLA